MTYTLRREGCPLGAVETWVFDLDNTLYPSDSDLWPKIDARITLFLCGLFGLDGISARALQKYYYQRYGTTLRGVMLEHDVRPAEFLAFTEIKLLNFFLEEPFRHLCHLPRPLYGGVEAAQRTPPQ